MRYNEWLTFFVGSCTQWTRWSEMCLRNRSKCFFCPKFLKAKKNKVQKPFNVKARVLWLTVACWNWKTVNITDSKFIMYLIGSKHFAPKQTLKKSLFWINALGTYFSHFDVFLFVPQKKFQYILKGSDLNTGYQKTNRENTGSLQWCEQLEGGLNCISQELSEVTSCLLNRLRQKLTPRTGTETEVEGEYINEANSKKAERVNDIARAFINDSFAMNRSWPNVESHFWF